LADGAEPKSIDEIASYGVSILPAKKGQGSVTQGISYLQSQRVSITKRSINTIKAYRNYMWKTDNNGNTLPVPDHYLSDCMDACRYAVNEFVLNVREVEEDNSYRPIILDPYIY
jgi:phage terminase large subunit